MHERTEDIIAAASCLILGGVGIFVNGSCVILVLRLKSLRTSFGYITLFHSLANALLVSSYPFWVAPSIIFDLSNMVALNRLVGQTTIVAQAASHCSMLLLAINRFVCIFFPTRYSNIFSNRTTLLHITLFCIVCIAYGCIYFEATCYFIFVRKSLIFVFARTQCGRFIAEYIDFGFSMLLFSLAIGLDVCTLIKWRMVMKRNAHISFGSVKRCKKELRLFAQTLCTTVLFSFTMICFHYIVDQFTARFMKFLSTTFIWGINHTGAGIIIVAFNTEIRQNILRPLRPKYNSSDCGSVVTPMRRIVIAVTRT